MLSIRSNFLIPQGTFPWQPILCRNQNTNDARFLQFLHQRRLIRIAFIALVLENELQYHGLAVRINSGVDGATSSKNLVNFCLLTPDMTGLICLPMYLYWAKINLTPAIVVLPFRNAMDY